MASGICDHLSEDTARIPAASQSVYREDCTQCFDSIDDPNGLNVCLQCFNGGCLIHNLLHRSKTGHLLYLNIRRTRKHRDEPPQKLSKLAISAETEEDRYDTKTFVFCADPGHRSVHVTEYSGRLQSSVNAVVKAPTFARQAEVQAWEQEMIPCEHTLCLEQDPARQISDSSLGQCSKCELHENLWLCLQCGNLACGRKQFGSNLGGNSHGLTHYDETKHPVAVKLGSITPEGTADIYCYACNDERVDPEVAEHLAHWGINIAEREKTEKSLTELQIEQNLKWDFSMTTEDGKELQPLFGKGLTGLKNLGNSCYLSSTFQCLFSLPSFQERYFEPAKDPPENLNPAEDLETQLQKMADGLLSGRYSKPDVDSAPSEHTPEAHHQKGLAPAMLKHLIGRGHEEFSTMRQQDAFEFLQHVFKLVSRSSQSAGLPDPTSSFRFNLEERLACTTCKLVRYKAVETDNITVPVPARLEPAKHMQSNDGKDEPKETYEAIQMKECFDIITGTEAVDYTCPSCGGKQFHKRSLFKTFPSILAVNLHRFKIVNWVPTKLDIPVLVEDKPFPLDAYKSRGQADGEELLPEEDQQPAFTADPAAMDQLQAMGFPGVRCEKALYSTGNSNTEEAMNWLLQHMDDADIDTPLNLGGSGNVGGGSSAAAVSPEALGMVTAMGIPEPQARKALKETGGDVERAVDWVFSHPDDPGDVGREDAGAGASAGGESAAEKLLAGLDTAQASYRLKAIICHKGTSVHAGHYVAFVRKEVESEPEMGQQWVLFNDEKVVKAVDVEEMKKFAYVYFFEKVDA